MINLQQALGGGKGSSFVRGGSQEAGEANPGLCSLGPALLPLHLFVSISLGLQSPAYQMATGIEGLEMNIELGA